MRSVPGREPFGVADLDPYYERVERYLGVRPRSDWSESVRTVERGFNKLGAQLEAVLSYTDRQVLSLLVDPIRGGIGGSTVSRWITRS